MRRESRAALAVIVAGALIRGAVGWANPPNNAYDDHLEVIASYARTHERPAPSECWQCYQPPLYYAGAAAVLTGAHALTGDSWAAWRSVQLANVLLSVAHLGIIWLALSLAGPGSSAARLWALAVVAFLPRDIFSAAMISNDVLLVTLTGAAIGVFLSIRTDEDVSPAKLLALILLVVAASWTKQSGLITTILPAALVPRVLRDAPRARAGGLAMIMVGLALAGADEAARWRETGELLVSNQHFFDHAEGQAPGTLRAVDFADFRLAALVQVPQMSEGTLDSFWTELFARLWFDYEPKLIGLNRVSRTGGVTAFVAGISCCVVWTIGWAVCLRRRRLRRVLGPALALQVLFLAVPLVQTLRFPYFSSMKAVFVLPALCVSALLLAHGASRIEGAAWQRLLLRAVVAMIAAASTAYAWVAVTEMEQVLAHGPIWQFPPLW